MSQRRFCLWVAMLWLLAGCTAAPATRLYLLRSLDAPAEKSTLAGRPVLIVIGEVRVPQYLDRPQIVTRGTGDRLVINEYAHWGSSFRDEMSRVLGENLEVLLAGTRVMTAPVPRNIRPELQIELEVTHFERALDGQVRLSARWWISPGEGKTPLTGEASLNARPAGEGDEALVAEMGAVYGELARAVAATVRQVVP